MSGNISEMIQETDIIITEQQEELTYDLYDRANAADHQRPSKAILAAGNISVANISKKHISPNN